MKKLLFVLATVLLFNNTLFAQYNKPDSTAWGVHFGYSFNGYSNLNLTRVTKSGWEFGGGLGLSSSTHKSTTSYTNMVADTGANLISSINTLEDKSNSSNLFFSPIIMKHFPIKSNVDVYASFALPIGILFPYINSYSSTNQANNYLYKITNTTYYPLGYSVGANVALGCRYFFYKNISLGANMGLGYVQQQRKGTTKNTIIVLNEGVANPMNTVNSETIVKKEYNIVQTNLNTFNLTLNMSYYFGK